MTHLPQLNILEQMSAVCGPKIKLLNNFWLEIFLKTAKLIHFALLC